MNGDSAWLILTPPGSDARMPPMRARSRGSDARMPPMRARSRGSDARMRAHARPVPRQRCTDALWCARFSEAATHRCRPCGPGPEAATCGCRSCAPGPEAAMHRCPLVRPLLRGSDAADASRTLAPPRQRCCGCLAYARSSEAATRGCLACARSSEAATRGCLACARSSEAATRGCLAYARSSEAATRGRLSSPRAWARYSQLFWL
jgi:hypothetical protein